MAEHTNELRTLAFSPDGKILVSGCFSADGKSLASASKTVRLWDTATGKQICKLTGHKDWVRSVAFSPDGKTLASGSNDSTVLIWDIATSIEEYSGTHQTRRILNAGLPWNWPVAMVISLAGLIVINGLAYCWRARIGSPKGMRE